MTGRSREESPPPKAPVIRLLHVVEVGGVVLGVVLLAAFGALKMRGEASRRDLVGAFDTAARARAEAVVPSASVGSLRTVGGPTVDQTLWSSQRIAHYRDSLEHAMPEPLAVLRIPRLALEVPVLAGTDDATLDRAVGLIPGTATPGARGNTAIAGHRDGFFRGLKDIAVGDRLELETLAGRQEYAVEAVKIVDPSDVSVLDDSTEPVVTLVTCYPFYFVGKAPQRFIVRAKARPMAAGDVAR